MDSQELKEKLFNKHHLIGLMLGAGITNATIHAAWTDVVVRTATTMVLCEIILLAWILLTERRRNR